MSYSKLFDGINCSLGQFYSLSPVLTCSKDSMVGDVIRSMNEKKVGSVIVVENLKPIGIFTERDVLQKVVGSQAIDIHKTPIENLMTKNPVTITLETTFAQIMAAMRLGKFRHLIIVNQTGQLQGIISIKDVLSHIVDLVNDFRMA